MDRAGYWMDRQSKEAALWYFPQYLLRGYVILLTIVGKYWFLFPISISANKFNILY